VLGFISCDFTTIPGYPALAGLSRLVCRIKSDFEFTAVFQFDYDSIACLGNFDFQNAKFDLSLFELLGDQGGIAIFGA